MPCAALRRPSSVFVASVLRNAHTNTHDERRLRGEGEKVLQTSRGFSQRPAASGQHGVPACCRQKVTPRADHLADTHLVMFRPTLSARPQRPRRLSEGGGPLSWPGPARLAGSPNGSLNGWLSSARPGPARARHTRRRSRSWPVLRHRSRRGPFENPFASVGYFQRTPYSETCEPIRLQESLERKTGARKGERPGRPDKKSPSFLSATSSLMSLSRVDLPHNSIVMFHSAA